MCFWEVKYNFRSQISFTLALQLASRRFLIDNVIKIHRIFQWQMDNCRVALTIYLYIPPANINCFPILLSGGYTRYYIYYTPRGYYIYHPLIHNHVFRNCCHLSVYTLFVEYIKGLTVWLPVAASVYSSEIINHPCMNSLLY